GTLFHHYFTDEKGIITKANLIVATGNNYGSICLSIKKAAQKLIKQGKHDDGLLNMVEMAFRIYDPCLSCATHILEERRFQVDIFDCAGNLVRQVGG
ncbi:MAG: Ni/Fe hydrogenase subunit alpha, partial [Planctomycetota bacterium]|nr:Ni/Fe hydrogenase subunit alpha [Planctomycetota bacterium]